MKIVVNKKLDINNIKTKGNLIGLRFSIEKDDTIYYIVNCIDKHRIAVMWVEENKMQCIKYSVENVIEYIKSSAWICM